MSGDIQNLILKDSSYPVVGNIITYNPAGLFVDVTDPRGIDAHSEYDNLGRVVETIAAYTDGVPTNDTNPTTLYGYTNGQLTSLTAVLPGGGEQQTQYVYGITVAGGSAVDSNDVLAATWHPDPTTVAASSSQAETLTYNALGQVLTATDRNGTTHTYSYDVLGRTIADAVTTLGAGVYGAVRRIEYGYDAQGNTSLVTSYDAVSGGSIVNQVERVYNGLGQLTTEYQAVGGAVDPATTPAVQYAYRDLAGGVNDSRLLSMTYPNGYVLNNHYDTGLDDAISRLSSLSDSGGTLGRLATVHRSSF